MAVVVDLGRRVLLVFFVFVVDAGVTVTLDSVVLATLVVVVVMISVVMAELGDVGTGSTPARQLCRRV